MNRKSERKYVIQAQARKRSCLTIKRGYNHFLKTYRKLIADRENRPFLDKPSNGCFYDKQNKNKKAWVL
jgi:hypothetical protein